jgi:hypothetical protein
MVLHPPAQLLLLCVDGTAEMRLRGSSLDLLLYVTALPYM